MRFENASRRLADANERLGPRRQSFEGVSEGLGEARDNWLQRARVG